VLNSKNILLTIVVAFILYMGIEIKNTHDAVTVANDLFYGKKFSKEAREVAYGPVKKKEKATAPIEFELFGTIDKSMAYSIRTVYVASSDKKSCKSFNSRSGGWVKASEDFEYHPKIGGGTHHIKVPLRIFDPKIKCKFKAQSVYINIFSRDNKKQGSTTLFLSRNHRDQHHRFKYTGSKDKMDIECIEPSPFNDGGHFKPCGYKPLKKRFDILGVLMNGRMKYELNIGKLPLDSLSKEELDYILRGE